MSNRFLMGLAPVVAVAAFELMPAAAHATPHYYVNGEPLAAGNVVPVLAWGTLTLTLMAPSTEPPTTCEDASGGFVENPEGPAGVAPGKGATLRFSSWNCSNAGCPPGEIEFPSGSGKKVAK